MGADLERGAGFAVPVVRLPRPGGAGRRGAAARTERLGSAEPLAHGCGPVRARTVDAGTSLRAAQRPLSRRLALRGLRSRIGGSESGEYRYLGRAQPSALVHGAGALVRRRHVLHGWLLPGEGPTLARLGLA